ncbi:MAG: hypothetical protein Kow0077_28060 [Anaerolineae bacterium]
MSETMRMWTEIGFNVLYLVAIWWLVFRMVRQRGQVPPQNQRLAALLIGAFALLALGDTGHVGFRVLAYAMGGLENAAVTIAGRDFGLVGMGALATAITVTFFYVLVLFMWQARYQKPLGWFGLLLLAAAAIRLIIMAFPQNEWNSVVPPQPWGLIRNTPLIIQGLGVMFLILRDARATGDRPFMLIGLMILASYAFYTPVILWVQQVPALGMLMIPKTLAYVAIAWIGYRAFFGADASAPRSAAPAGTR